MRGLADAGRLRRFLDELAREADADVAVYLTGGATAVLLGWRESTIDADILIVPRHRLGPGETPRAPLRTGTTGRPGRPDR
jgi:hypothetical protein